jgi:hypothetical protein
MGARSSLGPTRRRIQRRQLAVVALGSVSRLPLFLLSKKIRRVPAELMINSERAGVGYPYPRQPQGNYPGAQLCNFDCCLRRLGRLGLAIFRQSLGICSTARFGSSGHFAMREPCRLYPRKRTFGRAKGMSALSHKRTLRLIRSPCRREPVPEDGKARPSALAVLRLKQPFSSAIGMSARGQYRTSECYSIGLWMRSNNVTGDVG